MREVSRSSLSVYVFLQGGNLWGSPHRCVDSRLAGTTIWETYRQVLVKYKSDLARPFDEANVFLSNIETQLSNLCKG
uniref:Homeobox protein knotted-1-like 6 n=1 Tax=Tanacetum cinerariifolium TaxID=118510 RepID=A0A699JA63_TANCI|nr:homeobox protein knotted-1-like 6 [Tanacetum cinerariifolium]